MNETIDKFLPLERKLFFALNGSDSVFWDNVFWTYSGRFIWIPLFVFLFFLFFYKTPRKEAILTAVFFVLLFVVCDQVSSSVFKPIFHRFRPTHYPGFENMVDIVNGYTGGRYGFISGHATNSFGLAVFVSLVLRNKWVTLATLLWATVNSYSRIYLGVHFISDILAGAIVGTLIAILLYELYVWIRYKYYHVAASAKRRSVYSREHAKAVALFIPAYILLIIVFSSLLVSLPH